MLGRTAWCDLVRLRMPGKQGLTAPGDGRWTRSDVSMGSPLTWRTFLLQEGCDTLGEGRGKISCCNAPPAYFRFDDRQIRLKLGLASSASHAMSTTPFRRAPARPAPHFSTDIHREIPIRCNHVTTPSAPSAAKPNASSRSTRLYTCRRLNSARRERPIVFATSFRSAYADST